MAARDALADKSPKAAAGESTRVPLGLDGHSMRARKWKAPQFIELAAEQKLDAVLINNLPLFESLEESYLRGLKETADRHGLRIYMGAGSICENGSSFNDKYGDARTFLAEGIRVASIVGSPVVTVRIGKHVVCTSVRDYMVWESEREATGSSSLDQSELARSIVAVSNRPDHVPLSQGSATQNRDQ